MACGTRFQANKAWLKPLEEGKDLTATHSAVKHDLAISRLRVNLKNLLGKIDANG